MAELITMTNTNINNYIDDINKNFEQLSLFQLETKNDLDTVFSYINRYKSQINSLSDQIIDLTSKTESNAHQVNTVTQTITQKMQEEERRHNSLSIQLKIQSVLILFLLILCIYLGVTL